MYKPIYENNGKDKAVSPIIATILIVAITVVLAATLYAVIGGYGGLIGKATPSAGITVSTSAGTYTVSVTSVSGTVALSDIQVKILVGGQGYTVNLANKTAIGSTATGTGHYGLNYTATTGNFDNTVTVTFTPTTTNVPSAITSIAFLDKSTSGTIVTWTA